MRENFSNFARNLHRRNNFTEVLKIALDTDLKIILLNHQNYYIRISSMMSNAVKSFDILATSLSVLHNYFGVATQLF